MYEYNSATTIATATTISDNNSTSMMHDFVMGFQQYEDQEDEELEGEWMYPSYR